MIINIRGTNASGKSSVVKSLIEAKGGSPLYAGKKVIGYQLQGQTMVVGRYETACGGVDASFSKKGDTERVEQIIRDWAGEGFHVVFESILISTVYSRWLKLSQDFAGEYVWAFMDTPLDLCFDRVYERNGGKPIKRDLLESKYNTCRKHVKKAAEDGQRVVMLDHRDPLPQLLNLLGDEDSQLILPQVSEPQEAPFYISPTLSPL